MPHKCCVVGCTNSSAKEECKNKGVHFFCFPTRDPEQRELWIRAVKRLAEGGQPWQPKSKTTKICSEHFVGGQWSRTRGHPAHVPSIKLGHRKEGERTDKDVERFKRHQKRQLEKEHQQSPVATRAQGAGRRTASPRPSASARPRIRWRARATKTNVTTSSGVRLMM